MTEEEILGQVTTMLLAGHETTASSMTWLLYELAKPKNRHIQEKLRAEILGVEAEELSMEEIGALPYLDAVTRENLRVNSVVGVVPREAGKDSVIPLSTPVVGKDGVTRNEIRIAKGEQILVSVSAVNKDKTIWGEDAREFKPERWSDPSSHVRSHEIAGVFSDIMTFIGGPRHCIGYRFAVIEMKVLIFSLLRHISFSLPDPELNIEKRSTVVTRPVIRFADGSLKPGMPLVLTAVGSTH